MVSIPCPKCNDTGVRETSNNDLPCDCPPKHLVMASIHSLSRGFDGAPVTSPADVGLYLVKASEMVDAKNAAYHPATRHGVSLLQVGRGVSLCRMVKPPTRPRQQHRRAAQRHDRPHASP
jgi:hypothetical protein